MSAKIHINDLANPVYTEAQRAALDYGETLKPELTPASIMAEAQQKTGLHDWGAMDFLPRLALLCDEWGSDAGLVGLARLTLRNKLLQHATSRLLIREQFRQHPEIHALRIESPIIVCGLPRSGTTHLLNLMAADSRLRALPLWESYEPVPVPGEAALPDGTDPRYQRCATEWEAAQAMTPHMAAMHPMHPDHIHEELELMGPNFGSYNYEWLSHSPRWRDHYYADDQTSQYEYMRDVLKLLTWQQRGTTRPTRWVLKCPQHLEQTPVLTKVFPDATIAITHRDPVAVIQSSITMLAYVQRMSRRQVMTAPLLDYWTDRIRHLLLACTRDRCTLAPERSIDIVFHEFINDDVATVERIYRKAGLEMTAQARAELGRFVTDHKDDYGRVAYDLKGQFGTSAEELGKHFEFYYDAFPAVRRER